MNKKHLKTFPKLKIIREKSENIGLLWTLISYQVIWKGQILINDPSIFSKELAINFNA